MKTENTEEKMFDERETNFGFAAISIVVAKFNEKIFRKHLTLKQACREFLVITHGEREFEDWEIEDAESIFRTVGRIDDWERPPLDPRRDDVDILVVRHNQIYVDVRDEPPVMLGYDRGTDFFYNREGRRARGVDVHFLVEVPCPFTGKGGRQ